MKISTQPRNGSMALAPKPKKTRLKVTLALDALDHELTKTNKTIKTLKAIKTVKTINTLKAIKATHTKRIARVQV